MDELAVMTVDECWQRLGTRGVGRIGFDRGRGPRIHPVDYTVVDGNLYLRTSDSSEIGAFVRLFGAGAWVSFEVDHVEEDDADRWSVLVVAQAGRVESPSGDAAGDRMPEPTPAGPHPELVRLTPVEVTGRRLTTGRCDD